MIGRIESPPGDLNGWRELMAHSILEVTKIWRAVFRALLFLKHASGITGVASAIVEESGK